MRKKRQFILGAIALVLLIMFYGWLIKSGHTLTTSSERIIAISRLAGIVATAGVLLEFLVMSRAPFIENNFSLEEINEFHRYAGYTIVYSLIVHVVFVTVGYGALDHLSLWRQFWAFPSQFSGLLSALVGSAALITAAAFSIKLIRNKIPYEIWYFIHIIVYGSIILTFSHQIDSGGDVSTLPWMRAYWYLLFGLLFVIVAYHRFIRHISLSLYHGFRVEKIVPEANGIYSVYISGRRIQKYKYKAGQYAHWRFLHPHFILQNHPFSISSIPGSDHLRFTFKTSGDFTNKLCSVPIGTRLFVDGPRGSFVTDHSNGRRVLMIAGGIGVSPFVPLAKSLLEDNRDVTVLYSVVSRADVAFGEEFEQVAKSYPNSFRLAIHVASERGYITEASLLKFISQDKDEVVYICGPPAMINAIIKQLKNIGFNDDQIIAEQFSFA
jgi:predicted ferric reductase